MSCHHRNPQSTPKSLHHATSMTKGPNSKADVKTDHKQTINPDGVQNSLSLSDNHHPKEPAPPPPPLHPNAHHHRTHSTTTSQPPWPPLNPPDHLQNLLHHCRRSNPITSATAAKPRWCRKHTYAQIGKVVEENGKSQERERGVLERRERGHLWIWNLGHPISCGHIMFPMRIIFCSKSWYSPSSLIVTKNAAAIILFQMPFVQ